MTAQSAAAVASRSFFLDSLDSTRRPADRKPSKESVARRWIVAIMAARQRQADKRLVGYLRTGHCG
jgi:hypothetical protein